MRASATSAAIATAPREDEGHDDSIVQPSIATADRPIPSSWYCVAESRELARGAVLVRRLAGEDVVLFRGESGTPAVVGAYCPHLGAHLGHGGRVQAETIVCPFHAFRFDGGGACVATGYGGKTPPRARLASWRVCERSGWVLAWHGVGGAPPAWHVPELDHSGWTSIRRRTFSIAGHPQDPVENTVDYGHLPLVHGYRQPRLREEPKAVGPVFTAGLAFSRPRGLVPGSPPLEVELDIEAHGFGWSVVRSRLPALDFDLRHYVLGSPTSPGKMDLRIGLQGRFGDRRPRALRALPAALLANVVLPFAMRGYAADLRQDFPIWEHKRYVERPPLAAGDGPIGLFRRWAAQFYAAAEMGGSA